MHRARQWVCKEPGTWSPFPQLQYGWDSRGKEVEQGLFQPEAEEVKSNKTQALPILKWGTAYKINRKNCHKTSAWKWPLLCTFYSNQPGCCTAWSSGLHFVCYCAPNHSVSMFYPLDAEACSLIPFCHQPGSQSGHDCTKWEAAQWQGNTFTEFNIFFGRKQISKQAKFNYLYNWNILVTQIWLSLLQGYHGCLVNHSNHLNKALKKIFPYY